MLKKNYRKLPKNFDRDLLETPGRKLNNCRHNLYQATARLILDLFFLAIALHRQHS